VVRPEYATYLGLITEIRQTVTKPDANFSSVDKELKAVTAKVQPGELLGQFALKHLPNTLVRVWINIADISLAQTGLALERYRAAKDDYPATLADLVPDFLPKVPAPTPTLASHCSTAASRAAERRPSGAPGRISRTMAARATTSSGARWRKPPMETESTQRRGAAKAQSRG